MRALAILLAALAGGCASTPAPEPRGVTVEEVVRLSEAGVAPRVIAAKIRVDGLREDLSADRLIALSREKKLAPEVLEAMVDGGGEACPYCRCWDEAP